MKYKIFVFTILASVGFFNYHGILSEQMIKLLFYFAILLCLIFSFYHGRSLRDVDYPRWAYFYVLFGIAFSSVIATLTHMQGLKVSFMGTLVYLMPYMFLYPFLKMDMDWKKVMNIYIVLCIISAIIYFCNVLTMPFNMFGAPIINEDLSRGIIRIPVVFIEMFPLLVFYGINKWLDTRQKKWFVLIAFATMMIFLSVIRQVIAITGVLSVFFLFRKISLFKKCLLVAVVGATVVFVLPNIPIYKAMIELSEDQSISNDNEEDIRIQAWRFYTYENQESPLNVIFGNGVPSIGNSTWGTIFGSESETSGRFTHDVGWAGFFWFFGLLTTIALIVLIVKTIMYHKPPELKFLNYWFVFILITSVASGPIVYWNQIISIMTCIGLVYSTQSEASVEIEAPVQEASVVSCPAESQFRRYPQLDNLLGWHSKKNNKNSSH